MMEKLKLSQDVRWVYLAMTVAILLGLAFPFAVDVPPTEYSLAIYNAVESIEPGDYALIIWRGVPYMDDWATNDLVVRHIIQKGGYLIWYVEGTPNVAYMIREMNEVYGENWETREDYGQTFACFGYIPISEITLTNIATDATLVFQEDYFGTPVSELPVMEGLRSGEDVKLILGFPGAWRSIGAIFGQYETYYLHVETVGGLVGRIDSYRAGQLTGILAGARGAAEYQTLTGIPSPDNWRYLVPMLYLSVLGAIGFIVPNVYRAVKGGD